MTRRARAIPMGWGVTPADRRRLQRRRQSADATSAIQLDPETRQVRKGRIERRPFGVTIYLPKRLHSGNRRDRQHFIEKANEKRAWGQCLLLAALDSSPAGRRLALQTTAAGAVGWTAPPARARLVITRIVTSARHLADPDNLAWSAKPLVDSLVAAGFLCDDSPRHVESTYQQEVATDGRVWTVVAITVPSLDPAATPRPKETSTP